MRTKYRVLVLGGRGFIGRHIVKSLEAHKHDVTVGTRFTKRQPDSIKVVFHQPISQEQLAKTVKSFDTVINCVGIMRQRWGETYEQVQYKFVDQLVSVCAETDTRLIHLSVLGLDNPVRSRFLISKRHAEYAIKSSNADWAIVRPSLIDGDGGFGAKWFRRLAQWPVHLAPRNARGLLRPIHVCDLADAVRKIVETKRLYQREFELGGEHTMDVFGYLALLKRRAPLMRLKVPSFLVRFSSHILDLLHLTPLSFGHYELLKFDNVPVNNALYTLIQNPPRKLGLNHFRSAKTLKPKIVW